MHIMCEAAPATREEEVMVTLRSGMRDAAEELHMGVRGRRKEGKGVHRREGKRGGHAPVGAKEFIRCGKLCLVRCEGANS